MTRREFLHLGLCGAAGLAAGRLWPLGFGATGDRGNDLNVLFIICDDLNDSVEGMGGHPQAKTPNIDRLMRRGVRFSNAQCNDPICAPSRASLWSGLYPHTTGYFGYSQQQNRWRRNRILRRCKTVFEHFSANGYQVYATGKIHHNGHEDWSIFRNRDGSNGFAIRPDFGPVPWDGTQKAWRGGRIHPGLPEAMQGLYWDNSFGPITDLSKQFGGRGRWMLLQGKPFRYVSEADRDRLPDERSAEYAASVLQRRHKTPFFLAAGFNRPHAPLHVPKSYFDRFPLEAVELAPQLENDLSDCAKTLWKDKDLGTHEYGYRKYERIMAAGGKELLRRWTQAYLASVAFVDEQIGRLLNALGQSPYADSTLVVLTSDHGYHMGEKEQLFKNSVWEESMRVPLVVAGPGVAQGKECDHPVSLIDMYPTLIDYCRLPTDPNQETNERALAGHSIRPFLADPVNGKWDGPPIALGVVASGEGLKVNQPGKVERQHYSVRSKRHRYVLCNNGEEELYDHWRDPHEWTNLAHKPESAEIKKGLRAELTQLLRR